MIDFTVLLHLFLYFYVKNGHFSKKWLFSRNCGGGGLILSDWPNFGIRSLISAFCIICRVPTVKFQNQWFITPPTWGVCTGDLAHKWTLTTEMRNCIGIYILTVAAWLMGQFCASIFFIQKNVLKGPRVNNYTFENIQILQIQLQ